MEQANIQKHPYKIQLDSAHDKLAEIETRFIKNIDVLTNANANNNNLSGNNLSIGGNKGNYTPIISVKKADETFALPSGKNKSIGAFECKATNELYWFVWNELGQHTINVLDGNLEICQNVYRGQWLNFNIGSELAIPEHKVYLLITYKSTTNKIKEVVEKSLIFTDSKNNVRCVNVIASIATNSFNTPYFDNVAPLYNNNEEYITLAPIAPMYCPQFELIERVEGEDGRAVDREITNKLFQNPLQIAYTFNYIDNRTSSASPYSVPIIVGSTDCAGTNPELLPRCANVKFWVGNAFVNAINIYIRHANNGKWFRYDTIFKHDCPSDNGRWWERNNKWSSYNYDKDTNTIEYLFCNNKDCAPEDQAIFEHIENNIPFTSVSLASAGNNLLLGNCLMGSNNLTCEQVESFDVKVEEQESNTPKIPKRKITIYAIIRNDSYDTGGNGGECQFLFGNLLPNGNSSIDGKFYFGGFGWRKHPILGNKGVAIEGRSGWLSWKDYKQYVPSDIDGATGGFVGYLAGTEYTAISSQVKYNAGDCNAEELGIIYRAIKNMYDNSGSFDDIVKDLKNDEYLILQKFEFEDVLAGRYSFRIAGHRTGLSVAFEKTSTYVSGWENVGVCQNNEPFTVAIKKDYEFIIDVCDYDYNSLYEGVAMKIMDLTLPSFEDEAWNRFEYNFVREVYLYEDKDNSVPFEKQEVRFTDGYFKDKITGYEMDIDDFKHNGVPILLQDPITQIPGTPSGIVATNKGLTDHNGFAFYRQQFWRWRTYWNGFLGVTMDMTASFGEPTLGIFAIEHVKKCGTNVLPIQIGSNKVSPPVTILNNKGFRGLLGTGYKSTNTIDDKCTRVTIKGTLKDQDGKSLVGVTVGYVGSQFVRTGGFGKFKIIVHQNLTYSRCDDLLISNSGSSCTVACIGGNGKMCCAETQENICLPPCINCDEAIVDTGEKIFQKINFTDKGFRGRYGVGVVGWDVYGRIVTGGVNFIKNIDTSMCWEKHPKIKWYWNGSQLLPDEVKYISFFTTKNLYGTYLQWVAKKFELLDENGDVTTNKGKALSVAIDISSLLQYNADNQFKTLAIYGFVEGDILRIIEDCDSPIVYRIIGTTFGTLRNASDRLQQEISVSNNNGDTATVKTNFATSNGGTIIIPYDTQLDDILSKCNIKIEINRPYNCISENENYFEACCMLPVQNGMPILENCCSGIEESGCELNVWDVYKIFRRYPKNVKCKGNNPNDDAYFSSNITDMWGENVSSFGRIGIKNPYAKRLWNMSMVIQSNAFINSGVINGLGTFWRENSKIYDVQNFGGIQAMFSYRNMVGFICENDYFIADYKVPYLKNTGDKIVISNLDDNLGNAKQKTSDRYGALQIDTSSIIEQNGLVYFYSKGQYILTDFNKAIIASDMGMSGYFSSKHQYMNDVNTKMTKNELDRFGWEVLSGYDTSKNTAILTMRPRVGISTNDLSYVNEEREQRIDVGETIMYNHELKGWINFRGYIPEMYGRLQNSKSGQQLVSFIKGEPYLHNKVSNGYGEIYGNINESVIELPLQNIADKVKVLLSMTQENNQQPLFVDRIITNEVNSFSYLPKAFWIKKENIHYGAVNRDMSSYFDSNFMQQSTYFEGKRVFGNYAFIRFVVAGIDIGKYFEIANFLLLITGSELSYKDATGSNSATKQTNQNEDE